MVYCDNLGAICLARDQVNHDQTKHIDVRYHFLYTNKRVRLKNIRTTDNQLISSLNLFHLVSLKIF